MSLDSDIAPRPRRRRHKLARKRGKERAAAVIKFIETLTIPSGIGQGKPFKLMDWQKQFICDIYEP
ncbi:MAG: hypothetical protein J2P54_14200, partial [Bradyrhizobiaceae bacterium]|nr:hypothetical protein [Bradyrhizobiaceae bacterium]